MARLRIFLCTYRRPRLLRRALASLLAQTFADWTCELHNDAPGDDGPRVLLQELAGGDPRFTYHAHERNWGAVVTFNHAYAGNREPYAALLEDDNWWEPDFLATALSALEARPEAALVWANMKVWQETADGAWLDTHETIWEVGSAALREFRWPETFQAFDALHSQGAMVFRPGAFSASSVPLTTPLAIIEHLRERAARGPLLLLTTPLAHFARTLRTARSDDRDAWLQSKLLVAASFFDAVEVESAVLEKIWHRRRAQRPRDTGLLFLLAFALRRPRLLHPAKLNDALHFLLSSLRHPRSVWQGLHFRSAHPEVWSWLRSQSSRETPDRPVAHATVLDKGHSAAPR
jgi:glycosyltransferase involved in cell wall biosynthesis